MELVFLSDYSPRKKGDVVSFVTRDEVRTAEWYLSNNIAKLKCDCGEKPKGCSECDKAQEEAKAVAEAPVVAKVPVKKKKVN